MFKKVFASTAVLTAFIVNTAGAQEYSIQSKTWEVGLGVGGFIEGSKGDDKQSTAAGALRASYRYDPSWSVELEYMYSNNQSFRYTDDTMDIHRGILVFDWDMWPQKHYSPYFGIGGGYESFPTDAAKFNGAIVNISGGFRYIFAESWGLNVDAKYKYNLDHIDQNIMLTFAINYRFSTDDEAK